MNVQKHFEHVFYLRFKVNENKNGSEIVVFDTQKCFITAFIMLAFMS